MTCCIQFVIALLLCPMLAVHAHVTLGGTKYVFAIPTTYDYASSYPPHVLITTSSMIPVKTSLTIPGLTFEVNTTITKYEHADITLPFTARIADPGKHSKTVIIRSSDAVSIHCLDNEFGNSDGFLVLPTTQLGNEYYVVSYVPTNSLPSFFTVSALEYETSIQFLTKAGQEYHLTLFPFETYRFDGGDYEDLTGTRVLSNKPVSVISGGFTDIPVNSHADGLLANTPPVEIWGNSFVLVPFMAKSCGYVYRVQSSNHITTLTISDIGNVVLQAGEHYEGDVTGSSMVTISSDIPVLVVQYMKGYYACDTNGAPSMTVVPPMESYYSNVAFPVFDVIISCTNKYFINVITNCDDVGGLLYDDTTPMVDWDRLTTSDQSMCALRGEITSGVHSVTHANSLAKFSVAIYLIGTSCGVSYIYPAGIAPIGDCHGIRIISRAEWGARSPKSVSYLSLPVPYAFVHHTDGSACYSISECSAVVRGIQNYHMDSLGWSDIGYSFLVGEDGNIYEGRGWDRVGAHTPGHNSVGLAWSYMGSFTSRLPNTEAINAGKTAIACGVGLGKLTPSYTLRGHRDMDATSCPGNKLYADIQKWPHY